MSPSSFWATSVMPSTAVSPSSSTHSCVFVYLRSCGAVIASSPDDTRHDPTSGCTRVRSLDVPILLRALVKRRLYLYSFDQFATNFDLERLAHPCVLAVDQREADVSLKCRRKCPARDFPNLGSVDEYLAVR